MCTRDKKYGISPFIRPTPLPVRQEKKARTVSVRGGVKDSVVVSPSANVEIRVVEHHKKTNTSSTDTFRFLSLLSGNYTLHQAAKTAFPKPSPK